MFIHMMNTTLNELDNFWTDENGKRHFSYAYMPTTTENSYSQRMKNHVGHTGARGCNVADCGCKGYTNADAIAALKELGIKPVRISAAHWNDYESRQPTGHDHEDFIIRDTVAGTLYGDPTHPVADDLLSDAEHYADGAMDDMLEDDDDGWARSIINGAKTTAKNLKAAGVTL